MVPRFGANENPLGLVANLSTGAQDVGWWGPRHSKGEAMPNDPGDHAGTMLIAVTTFLLCLLFL